MSGKVVVGIDGSEDSLVALRWAKDAHRMVSDAIEHLGPDAEVEAVLVRGAAAEALIRSTHPPDLLVVGSRGLGGFKGLLLGSVSTHCVQHASCPVVVVPSR